MCCAPARLRTRQESRWGGPDHEKYSVNPLFTESVLTRIMRRELARLISEIKFPLEKRTDEMRRV